MPGAPDKKSFSSVSSPIFACRVFTSITGSGAGLRSVADHPRRALKPLAAPLLDLVRMHVEILRQPDQRLLALDRGHGHFCLECRAVIPARSSCHSHLLACSIMPLLRGKSTYPTYSVFPNHFCTWGGIKPRQVQTRCW